MSLFSSCDLHEFPELATDAQFTLHLDFDTDMPLYKEVVQTNVRSVNSFVAYDIRHIVSVHRLSSNGSYSRTADTLIVVTNDDLVNLNRSIELKLREGRYNFFVWTDFVDKGSQTDKFYATSDFSEIILLDRKNHIGNCDYRDAYVGVCQATVSVMRDEMTKAAAETTVKMERPLAKFKVISTDYKEFVEKVLKAQAQKNGANAAGEAGIGTELKEINPNDYRVVFRYMGFMPCSYNVFTGKPADSWTGVSFTSALKPTENGEAELGFDYVFVNGSEAGVSVMVEVRRKDGELVASSPTIDIPLKRGRMTVVRGKFLNSIVDGGANIVPDFDGEYNIRIV